MRYRLTLTLEGSRWLVTGASSGLGRAIAIGLAERGVAALELVARRKDLLESLGRELGARFGTDSRITVSDLSDTGQTKALAAAVSSRGSLDGLVLNAGVTFYGRHADLDTDRAQKLIDTNATGPTVLMMHLHDALAASERGAAILVVSSAAGDMPVPYQALYSGTKAFLTAFGLALGREFSGSGTSVTVFAPSGIDTEMIERSGLASKFENHPALMDPAEAAERAIRAVIARKPISYPGPYALIANVLARLLPRSASTLLLERTYRPPL